MHGGVYLTGLADGLIFHKYPILYGLARKGMLASNMNHIDWLESIL